MLYFTAANDDGSNLFCQVGDKEVVFCIRSVDGHLYSSRFNKLDVDEFIRKNEVSSTCVPISCSPKETYGDGAFLKIDPFGNISIGGIDIPEKELWKMV